MSFANTMKRAGDHPNAFKLARRMIESWSPESACYVKPEKGRHDYTYSVEHDGSSIATMALALVEASLQKVSGNQDRFLYNDYNKPITHVNLTRSTFPVPETLRQLDVLQHQLQSNWVKDDDGNYRHVKAFEHTGRHGPDIDLDHFDRCRFQPALFAYWLAETNGQFPEIDAAGNNRSAQIQDAAGKMELLCAFDGDAKKPIKNLPVDDHELELPGYTVGLCLTPEQVGMLSQAVGFLNPARSKSAA